MMISLHKYKMAYGSKDVVKYFLTLGDVTKDNGPTVISIGSHHDGVYRYRQK